jgi:uncharacterized protein (TIGR03086 family)
MSELTDAAPAQRHRIVAGHFAEVIDGVRDWDAPSPVREWKASDVVDHLTSWLPGFLDSMAGVTLEVLTEAADTGDRFRAQADAVQALLDAPDAGRPVETHMFGTMPLERLIDQFYTADVFMHTWDLATASGQPSGLDPEWAAQMREGMAAMGDALRQGGMFGPVVPVADDANPVDRLIGLIGRDPNWTAA